MEAHITEWLNLAIRWFHVIVGIAWIGASFYFNWLENSLNRREGLRPGIAGDLWAVHGGGFYFVEKYRVAPEQLPKTLHWFKYEAYFTWISGFALLCVVYYLNADLYLVDPAVYQLTPAAGIGLGIGALIVGWLGYDLLCRSRLSTRPVLLSIIGLGLATGVAFALTQLMSGRAAFIHVGAMLGTCMAANVFFVIIPNQKKMVQAMLAGEEPDGRLGKAAGLRSLHNNYLTLPVVFIMVSSHFPSTFSHTHNWAILLGISVVGAIVRHWFNLKGKGHLNYYLLPVALVGMVSLAFVTAPGNELSPEEQALREMPPVTFAEVQAIVTQRCTTCHSATPTDEVWQVAPLGVMFDTPAQMQVNAQRIKARAYDLKTMPLANQTEMTDEERKKLGAWVIQGASIE